MKKKIASLIVLPFIYVGCSSSDDAAPSTNAFSAALSALEEATPSFNSGSSFVSARAAISSNWNVSNSFTNVDGGALDSTIVDHMSDLMGSSTDNSIFSRAGTPFMIACTIEALATKSGTTYATGTQTFVLNVANLTACGTSSDYGPAAGTTVTAVISNLSSTTNYDQKVILTAASNPQFGGKEQVMFVRNTSSTLNFLHVETDSFSSATDTFVTMISFDKATESGYFQYASINTNVRYLYRIAMSSSDNAARTFTRYKDSSRSVTTHVGSLFTNQSYAALSISWTGLTGSSIGGTGTDNNGCIDTTTTPASVSQDNSLTCSANSVSISAVSTNTLTGSFDAATAQDLADIGATDGAAAVYAPAFTTSTILSAALGF